MSISTLKIVYDPPVKTDLIKKVEVSLLRGEDGYGLRDWRPAIAQYKGGGVWQSSPLVDGRHLVSAQWDNAVETFNLVASSVVDQDELILFTQDLKRILEKAVELWKTDRQTVPVYIEAQAACETNPRYATIKSWSSPSEGNPYGQPFRNQDGSAMTNIILNVERGHWQETPIGTGNCVEISGLSIGNESQTFVPTGGTDDAFVFINAGTIFAANANLLMGAGGGGEQYWTGIRFRNVTIANGTGIVKANLRLVADQNKGTTTCNIRVVGEQNAAPAAFSTYANFVGRTRTDAVVAWNNLPAWVIGAEYESIDISAVVQEIVDLGGWASGQDLVIFLEDNGSSAAVNRSIAAFESAIYTEPQLDIISEVSQVGRAATCDREVFVANKHNQAQLTHIFVYDGAVPSANQAGVASFDLFPAGGGAPGDAVYFGIDTTTADSGPFCSLVFDLINGNVSGNVDWEYWNGAWVNFTNDEICDNTNEVGSGVNRNGLTREEGVWSVHWRQPSDWATTAVNGVTGYWVRCYMDAVGAGTVEQQNRPVYSILWPFVEIENASQVLGDIPAIIEAQFQPMSQNCAADVTSADVAQLYSNKAMVGLRSLHRGANFTPFINLQQEQNPDGITIAYGANTAESTLVTTATGRVAIYNAPGPGVDAMADRVRVQFSKALASEYYGTYRLMLRGRAVTNAELFVEIQQRINTYSTIKTSPIRRFQNSSLDWQILDFGQWSIPGFSDINNDEGVTGMEIVIRTRDDQTVIHGDLYYYELILWPVDEWAAEALDISEDHVQGWAGGDRTDEDVWRYLSFDSIGYPRRILRSITKVTDADVRNPWRPVANGPAIAQANQSQRFWFVSWRNNPAGSSSSNENLYRSEAYVGSIVTLNKSDRYLSMRGAR